MAKWTDHDTWSRWSPDTEWVRFDGPVQVGGRGVLKPKGGPKVRFEVSVLRDDPADAEYTDINSLPGAKIIFRHTARTVNGRTELVAEASVHGPLARVWALIMGKDFAHSVPEDLELLVTLVEADSPAEASMDV